MSGIGNSPFGSGPFGVGTPIAAPTPGGAIFRDPKTGESRTGRYIDPETGRYAFDEFGRVLGQATVPQLVQIAYATVRGSSVIASLGNRLSTLQTIGSDYAKRIDTLLREPVADLVNAKQMAITKIDVQRLGTSSVIARVYWRDLTTGTDHVETL